MGAKRNRIDGLLRGTRNYGMRARDLSIYPAKLKVARVLARPEVAKKVFEFKSDFAKLPTEELLGKAWKLHITNAFPKVLRDEAYRAYVNLAANLKSASDAKFVVQVLAEAKALGYLQ